MLPVTMPLFLLALLAFGLVVQPARAAAARDGEDVSSKTVDDEGREVRRELLALVFFDVCMQTRRGVSEVSRSTSRV